MGLVDDKADVFKSISSYVSMIQSVQATDTTNIFPSINNKSDIVPFLLDLIKTIAGSDALKEMTGELFTNFIDKIEPELKSALKKQVTQFNSNVEIPSYFKSTGAGISVPMASIDIDGLTKIPRTSASGNVLYSDNALDFNNTLYDTVLNDGTEVNFGSALTMKYDSNTDKITFKQSASLGTDIGTWASTYINDLQIINKKEFMTTIMNKIYGTIAKAQGKTVQQTYDELVVDQLIDQLINDDDSFIISPEDNEALMAQAQNLINGVTYYDMGCGLVGATLPMSGLTSLISKISGATDSIFVSDALADTADSSITNPAVAAENKQTTRDGFFQKIIKLITQTLAKALTSSPQIRSLLGIISAFQNKGTAILNKAKDDMKKYKTLIQCNIKAAMKMINKFIFDTVKKYLVWFLVPIVKKIIKEKITQYSAVIKGLIPVKTG